MARIDLYMNATCPRLNVNRYFPGPIDTVEVFRFGVLRTENVTASPPTRHPMQLGVKPRAWASLWVVWGMRCARCNAGRWRGSDAGSRGGARRGGAGRRRVGLVRGDGGRSGRGLRARR